MSESAPARMMFFWSRVSFLDSASTTPAASAA